MLINPYAFTGYTPTDADAAAYIAAVEAADGVGLEAGVKQAINNFVAGCKTDGTWTAIKAACILAGARTLSGALVPLVGTAPTNNNFISGDYNRKTGLLGNGSTKYLNTNRAGNADPQNNMHAAIYNTSKTSIANVLLGQLTSSSPVNLTQLSIGSQDEFYGMANSDSVPNGVNPVTYPTFAGVSRNASATYVARINGSNTTITNTSVTPGPYNYFVFCRNSAGSPAAYSNPRIAFYSIGTSLSLSLLDSRVTTLINALAAAIP